TPSVAPRRPFFTVRRSRAIPRPAMAGNDLRRNVHQHLARAAPTAVLPEVDPLPGAEHQAAPDDRDREGDTGEGRLDVRGDVVGTFRRWRVGRVVLGQEALEPGLEIALRRGIGVLLDHEARGGVPHEDGAEALVELGAGHERLHLARDLVQTLAARVDLEQLDTPSVAHNLVSESP